MTEHIVTTTDVMGYWQSKCLMCGWHWEYTRRASALRGAWRHMAAVNGREGR